MTALLVVVAALVGIGLWGALSQQSIVMVLMGVELMLNGLMLATVAFWATSAGGAPEGQVLTIVVLAVMAVEMAVGFALLIALYRTRQVDVTDSLDSLEG